MATYVDAIAAAVVAKIASITTGGGYATTVQRVVRGAPRIPGDRPPNATPAVVYLWIEEHVATRGPVSTLWTSTVTLGFTAHAQATAGTAGAMEDAAFKLYSDIVAVLQADPSIGLSYVHDLEEIRAVANGAAPEDPEQPPSSWMAGAVRYRYVVTGGA